MTTTSDARKRLAEKNEPPTPAPVTVPDYRMERVGSCNVSSVLASQWRNDVHWHVTWPTGESWCYETADDAADRVEGLRDLALRYPESPRPEPVADPLPSEVVEAAVDHAVGYVAQGRSDIAQRLVQHLAAAGYRLVPEDDEPAALSVEVRQSATKPTFVRIEREGVPVVMGYVHVEQPEDDEDTVRVPRDAVDTLRRQVAAVRSLAELDTGDIFLKPGTKIRRVQEDRRRDLGAVVTTSMVTVQDLKAALDGAGS